MSNKKNLSTNETDLTRRKLLTSAGILAAGGVLSSAVKADEKCVARAKPAWDKPFTGEVPEKLPEGYNILLVVTDQERFFPTFPFPVPSRERLMKTGVTFCNHQNTSNVCTPSRSVLYTGLHMPQTKMFDNLGLPWMPYDLDPALGTTGHMMQELGYYTAIKVSGTLQKNWRSLCLTKRMRILMSEIFLNQNYIKLWKNMVFLTITASAIL